MGRSMPQKSYSNTNKHKHSGVNSYKANATQSLPSAGIMFKHTDAEGQAKLVVGETWAKTAKVVTDFGGKGMPNEAPWDTARRVCFQETGIVVPSQNPPRPIVLRNRFNQAGHYVFLVPIHSPSAAQAKAGIASITTIDPDDLLDKRETLCKRLRFGSGLGRIATAAAPHPGLGIFVPTASSN